jgi:hypothetical protein
MTSAGNAVTELLPKIVPEPLVTVQTTTLSALGVGMLRLIPPACNLIVGSCQGKSFAMAGQDTDFDPPDTDGYMTLLELEAVSAIAPARVWRLKTDPYVVSGGESADYLALDTHLVIKRKVYPSAHDILETILRPQLLTATLEATIALALQATPYQRFPVVIFRQATSTLSICYGTEEGWTDYKAALAAQTPAAGKSIVAVEFQENYGAVFGDFLE